MREIKPMSQIYEPLKVVVAFSFAVCEIGKVAGGLRVKELLKENAACGTTEAP